MIKVHLNSPSDNGTVVCGRMEQAVEVAIAFIINSPTVDRYGMSARVQRDSSVVLMLTYEGVVALGRNK